MANPAGELARRLAEVARGIRDAHGDLPAQVVPYLLTIGHWGANAARRKLEQALPDPNTIASIHRVLADFDLEAIAAHYLSQGRDPAIYFYEEFLRAYDPANARKRGVHYTPPQVVSYIVRACAELMEEAFGQTLSDASVIDPCCGVGTFLRHIKTQTEHRPQMLGLELAPAQAVIASRMGTGAVICSGDFLSPSPQPSPPGGRERVCVILGNPPYSGHSANPGGIAELMADYREGLNERNPKWLQDDYVKFIRAAQHRIDGAGRGIVAFITNHSYLFNPTFRAMRRSLMRSFDRIYVLDLHGNAKKADRDQSIFTIQTGVAISIFVRTSDEPSCEVRYADLTGRRSEKLSRLEELGLGTTPWRELKPAKPFSLFVPSTIFTLSLSKGADMVDRSILRQAHNDGLGRARDEDRLVPITDIFHRWWVGFATSRDRFAVDFDRDALLERIAELRDPNVSADCIREEYPVGDLDIERARKMLLDDPDWESRAVEVLYRPFDRRWAYLSSAVMERPRLPFMESLLHENVALAVGRAGHATGSVEWDVAFVTDCPTDLNLFRRGGATLFPRYLYEGSVRQSNIKLYTHDPELLFSAVYAILHSPTYRARYADLLAIDYPRIPIPTSQDQLGELAALGDRLIGTHLLRSQSAKADFAHSLPVTSVPGRVSCITIGGYELPRKYIEDRKNRALSPKEIEHIERIRVAIAEAARIQARIDRLFPSDL